MGFFKRAREEVRLARLKADDETTRARRAARRRIISAANRHRIDPSVVPAYSAKTLQRAVAKVRRHGLVKPEILEAAGFRAER